MERRLDAPPQRRRLGRAHRGPERRPRSGFLGPRAGRAEAQVRVAAGVPTGACGGVAEGCDVRLAGGGGQEGRRAAGVGGHRRGRGDSLAGGGRGQPLGPGSAEPGGLGDAAGALAPG